MIFGTPARFAVEALVEPGPEFGPVQGRNVVGRVRVWIGGEPIGRIEEPACWLRPLLNHLLELRDRLHTLWEPSIAGLSADAIFDRLDGLYFGARRGASLRGSWTEPQGTAELEEAKGYWRFVFLLHSSESFDGWKAFLVRPTTDSLLALVARHTDQVVVPTTFPEDDFRDAVAGFASWLATQEQRLLPGEPR